MIFSYVMVQTLNITIPVVGIYINILGEKYFVVNIRYNVSLLMQQKDKIILLRNDKKKRTHIKFIIRVI